jgi:SAM-dependent methyltransferase
MKKIIAALCNRLFYFGLEPMKFFQALRGLPRYWRDKSVLKQQMKNDKSFPFGNPYPILTERNEDAGTLSGHYFHQDLFVAQQIFLNKPKRHLDIGSRVDGFSAHVAVFRTIEILDVRPLCSKVDNIIFRQADLMQLPDDLIECCDSISALHSIEHFGLGRYGDPIDFYGHVKAVNNIAKMLAKNGTFYFSVPIGPQRIDFNAQRVFSVSYLLNLFTPPLYSRLFDIISFSYVDDKGDFYGNVELDPKLIEANFNCFYGVGIFILRKS